MIGFDIERHVYGDHRYPAQLVVQDVLTLDGAQFRDADLIVASPPCQEYSYMAQPWKRAKQIAAALRGEDEFPEGYRGSRTLAELNALFDACFRIQREACAAAGRHIPLIVENVRGAQPWVGRARWNFGSYYLWGDVPALMPPVFKAQKNPGFRFDGSGRSFQSESVETAYKSQGMNWSDRTQRGQDFTRIAGGQAIKNNGGSWFNIGSPGQKVTGQNPDGRKTRGDLNKRDGHGCTRHLTNPSEHGVKNGKDWFGSGTDCSLPRQAGSRSAKRKLASAMIAKIPLPLSRHIAMTFGRSLTTAAPPC